MRLIIILLITSSCSLATAVDAELAKITDSYNNEVAKAEQAFVALVEEAEASMRETAATAAQAAIRDLERLAKRATRSGDAATQVAAWKETLRIDREHTEARAFFTSIGSIDLVLAELDGNAGNDKPGTASTTTTVAEAPEVEPLDLAVLASTKRVSILSLKEGAQAMSDAETPITNIPEQLQRASFIQTSSKDSEYLSLNVATEGSIVVVAGPGYSGMRQLNKAGFSKQDWTLTLGGKDLPVYTLAAPRGHQLELPPGPVVVIAQAIRFMPPRFRR